MQIELKAPSRLHRSSPFLFRMEDGVLNSYSDETSLRTRKRAGVINEDFQKFVKQKNYPCIAAKATVAHRDYRLGIYESLGSGRFARDLCLDLATFKREYARTNSRLMTLVATYGESTFPEESSFEEALWSELSAVASVPEFEAPGDPLFSEDPADPDFCFSFQGDAFFVVGMHPGSSRISRRFTVPALVFNLYAQFEQLDEETEFYPMVKKNRELDQMFHGDVNPMVEKYAEKWESIQFSGRENPPEWKCPFKRLMAKVGLRA